MEGLTKGRLLCGLLFAIYVIVAILAAYNGVLWLALWFCIGAGGVVMLFKINEEDFYLPTVEEKKEHGD